MSKAISFGRYRNGWREKAGLSRRELAKILDVQASYVSYIEQNKRKPSRDRSARSDGLFLTRRCEGKGPAQGQPTPWRNDAGSSEADIFRDEEALGLAQEEDGVAENVQGMKPRHAAGLALVSWHLSTHWAPTDNPAIAERLPATNS